MNYSVRNIQEGSRPAPPGFSSWLDFWEKKTGIKAGTCHRYSCREKATDGSHVQLTDGSNAWYIVPLCHACNMQKGKVITVEGPLVPVNPSNKVLW